MFHRKSGAVAYGVAIALCAVDPGMDYFRALTDGEGEALLMKARQDAMRSMK
jgi:hypothetical protein